MQEKRIVGDDAARRPSTKGCWPGIDTRNRLTNIRLRSSISSYAWEFFARACAWPLRTVFLVASLVVSLHLISLRSSKKSRSAKTARSRRDVCSISNDFVASTGFARSLKTHASGAHPIREVTGSDSPAQKRAGARARFRTIFKVNPLKWFDRDDRNAASQQARLYRSNPAYLGQPSIIVSNYSVLSRAVY